MSTIDTASEALSVESSQNELMNFMQGRYKASSAIRGKLGDDSFDSFVTTPKDLLEVAFVSHQALSHPDGTPASGN